MTPHFAPAPAELSGSGMSVSVSLADVRRDEEVCTLIAMADRYLEAVGYTDHGVNHVDRVAGRARRILLELGHDPAEAELAAISGLLHDIGNVIHRDGHAQSGGLLSYSILRRLGLPVLESALVAGAIGNHDEEIGEPVSNVAAALILADKSDVIRSRVRDSAGVETDIHDRVNYAVTQSQLLIDPSRRFVALLLTIDTDVSPVMEYFEIFLTRMTMCRRAARYLNCSFSLVINEVPLL
jgi:hypothetical protein